MDTNNCISLENIDKTYISMVLQEGILKKIDIYVLDYTSDKWYKLKPNQIDRIVSKHPDRASITLYPGRMTDIDFTLDIPKTQYINYKNLWVDKTILTSVLSNSALNFNHHAKFNSTERSTMLKLIYGMAIKKWGYKPEANRNSATGEGATSISAQLASIGLNLSNDTILNLLKEAHELHKNEETCLIK